MSVFSSQHHSFDIALASRYGVECAILIHHFQHWIRINQFAKRNIRNGKCWSYQSRKDIQAHFPYWSFDEVRRLCEKLVDLGVLITGNYNKSKVDKTLWYAFKDEKEFQVDEEYSKNLYERRNCPSKGKSASPDGKTATPIPDSIPDPKASDKKREREAAPPPLAPKSYRIHKRVKIEQEKFDKLYEDFGEAKVSEMMERLDEYADLNPKRFKQYACHAAVIRKWIREDEQKQATQPKARGNGNREWLEKVKAKYQHRNDIYFGSEGVSFTAGQSQIHMKFQDFGFKDQVINRLRKMGLSVEGL